MVATNKNLPPPQNPYRKSDGMQVGGTHYSSKTVQPWHAMESWMTREQFAGFLRGNAIKYLARCEDKGGVEDLKKARHYLDRLIEHEETANAELRGRPLADGPA